MSTTIQPSGRFGGDRPAREWRQERQASEDPEKASVARVHRGSGGGGSSRPDHSDILLFQAFHIPSGSMENTLLEGDFLFVSKTLYGAEIPFSGGKRLAGHPRNRSAVMSLCFAIRKIPRRTSSSAVLESPAMSWSTARSNST